MTKCECGKEVDTPLVKYTVQYAVPNNGWGYDYFYGCTLECAIRQAMSYGY